MGESRKASFPFKGEVVRDVRDRGATCLTSPVRTAEGKRKRASWRGHGQVPLRTPWSGTGGLLMGASQTSGDTNLR